MGATILTLVFATIKSKHTKVHDDVVLNAVFIQALYTAIELLMVRFAGFWALNPAMASAYIFFETLEFNSPNVDIASSDLNRYLWAFWVGPLFGAIVGGILHMIHTRCSSVQGRDNENEKLIE